MTAETRRAARKMDAVSELRKKYCPRAMAVAVLAGALMIALDYKPIGKGIILGALFSVLNFMLMSQALPRAVGAQGRGAFFASLGSILLRYALMGFALFLGAKYDAFNFFAVAGSLFSVQAVMVADHVLSRKKM